MNLRTSTLIAALLGACTLLFSSCVGTEGGYVGGYGPSRTYSNYSVTLGDGYAGRGYYYGPPNSRYYNRQPGVVYYRTRESVPSQYWGHSGSPSGHVHVTTGTRPSSYPSGYRGTYRDSYGRDGDRWEHDRRDGDRYDGDRDDDDDDDYGRGAIRR
jgi:hypothetical protein